MCASHKNKNYKVLLRLFSTQINIKKIRVDHPIDVAYIQNINNSGVKSAIYFF